MSERMTDDRILGYERIWNTLGSREKELLQALKAEREWAKACTRSGSEQCALRDTRIAELEARVAKLTIHRDTAWEANIAMDNEYAELKALLESEDAAHTMQIDKLEATIERVRGLRPTAFEVQRYKDGIQVPSEKVVYLSQIDEALGDKA